MSVKNMYETIEYRYLKERERKLNAGLSYLTSEKYKLTQTVETMMKTKLLL